MNAPEFVGLWEPTINLILQGVTLGALLIAIWQLRQSRLASLLSTEDSIAIARARYIDVRSEIDRIKKEAKHLPVEERIARFEVADALVLKLDDCHTQFLNRLDRLCASVLRREIPESHAKDDYEGMVRTVCTESPDILQAGNPHTNIAYFYNRWCRGLPKRSWWRIWDRG